MKNKKIPLKTTNELNKKILRTRILNCWMKIGGLRELIDDDLINLACYFATTKNMKTINYEKLKRDAFDYVAKWKHTKLKALIGCRVIKLHRGPLVDEYEILTKDNQTLFINRDRLDITRSPQLYNSLKKICSMALTKKGIIIKLSHK